MLSDFPLHVRREIQQILDAEAQRRLAVRLQKKASDDRVVVIAQEKGVDMTDPRLDTLDRMLDFALLPESVQQLGERLQRERDVYRAALEEVSAAWNAWMENEDGEGMDRMTQAILAARQALED